jgi:hypothetical protein
LSKMSKIKDAEKIASSTNVPGKIGYLHAED